MSVHDLTWDIPDIQSSWTCFNPLSQQTIHQTAYSAQYSEKPELEEIGRAGWSHGVLLAMLDQRVGREYNMLCEAARGAKALVKIASHLDKYMHLKRDISKPNHELDDGPVIRSLFVFFGAMDVHDGAGTVAKFAATFIRRNLGTLRDLCKIGNDRSKAGNTTTEQPRGKKKADYYGFKDHRAKRSRYEYEGEYVAPRPRDEFDKQAEWFEDREWDLEDRGWDSDDIDDVDAAQLKGSEAVNEDGGVSLNVADTEWKHQTGPSNFKHTAFRSAVKCTLVPRSIKLKKRLTQLSRRPPTAIQSHPVHRLPIGLPGLGRYDPPSPPIQKTNRIEIHPTGKSTGVDTPNLAISVNTQRLDTDSVQSRLSDKDVFASIMRGVGLTNERGKEREMKTNKSNLRELELGDGGTDAAS